MVTVTEQQVNSWVERYVDAWRTYEPGDIAALFTNDAEYHEWGLFQDRCFRPDTPG
jgi:hypothetical protein